MGGMAVRHMLTWDDHTDDMTYRPGQLRVACIQMESGSDKAVNIAHAKNLVEAAAATGADLVVLPEHWNMAGDTEALRSSAEDSSNGPTLAAMSDWAARWSITLVGGSIMERGADSDAIFNTAFVFAPNGSTIGAYRKVHLFDVDAGGHRYRESEMTSAGSAIVVVSVADWRIGISLCYDVRFPELYSALATRGAYAIVVPAYFTVATGRDHWQVLLRARAIENQVYILAAGQCGEPAPRQPAYGRSLICDPWGVVTAQAADEETVITAQLRRDRVESVRRSLPSLAHRRPDIYSSWSVQTTAALA